MNTIIEILIDISGSMGTMKGHKEENKYLLSDGSTRIALAKRILLEEIIRTLDYSEKVFVRTFNAGQGDKPIVTLIYEGPFDEIAIRSKIGTLPDDTSGGTPITAAVEASVANLKKKEFQNHERSIILLTDGEENVGNGDYTVAAEKARTVEGIECKIYIIGILLDEVAETKAKALAENTGGAYIPFKETKFSSANIRRALAPIKGRIIEDSIKNLSTENQVSNPELLQKLKELQQKLDSIKDAKEYTLLIDQIDILKSRLADIQLIQEKANIKILESIDKRIALIRFNEIEENFSKKIDQVFLTSQKNIDSLASQISSLRNNTISNNGTVEYTTLNLLRKCESLESRFSEQLKLSKEIVLRLTDQNKLLGEMYNNFRNRAIITWVIVIVGIIITLIISFL